MKTQSIIDFGQPLQNVEKSTPEPTGSQVLVAVKNCGVCHSDVHIHDGYFDLGGGNQLPVGRGLQLPFTLGHEIEGEVVAIGPEVRGVAVGERRVVFPWIGCGTCPACLRDEEHLCGTPHQIGCSVDGGYSTHVLVPHSRYLLDYGNTDPALAATYMCSGLTAFSALRKVGAPGPSDEVLILGVGGVGMMGVQFAQSIFGKAPLAADIDDDRLAVARQTGAREVYNTTDPDSINRLMSHTGGGVYGVVDFVGSEATFTFANSVIRRGGKIVVVGLFGGSMAMPLPMFPLRQMSLVGSFVGSLSEAQQMMEMVRAGFVSPIPVERRPLDQANETLDDLRDGRIVGRVVLNP